MNPESHDGGPQPAPRQARGALSLSKGGPPYVSAGAPQIGAPYVQLRTGLIVLLLVFLAMYWRSSPPAPRPIDVPANTFSAGRAYEVLRDLVGDGVPHPIGSAANAALRARVVARFEALGYAPEVHSTFACNPTSQACGTVHNVIAVRRGREPGQAVMLATHYDSVAAGPGASDDALGVAASLEIARIVGAEPEPRHSIVFLVDDGEEAGLLGAWGFVRDHPLARDIGAVVNLEARGTSGQSVMFETSQNNDWLIRILARSAARPIASSMFYPIYERLPNDTDLTVFKRAGLAGVNFAFIGDVPRYHTPLDDVGHASRGSLQHHGDNALAMVRALANADLDQPRSGNVVFFDLLGFAIVRWPITWTRPLAWLGLVLVILAGIVTGRRQHVSLWRGLLGLIVWIVMIAAAAGATWGLLTWLTNRGEWPGGATTAPRASVLAFWAIGFAVATLLAAVFARWTKPAGAWIGCWLGWAIGGVAVALFSPEASYLLIVPALVAGAVAIAGALPGSPAFVFQLATLLPAAIAGLLLMPSAWVLFDAIGPPALPVIGAVLGLIASTLASTMGGSGRARWLVPATTLACGAILTVTAVSAPAFSVDRPERMNITFAQHAGSARSTWMVSPQSSVLPESFRRVADFGAGPEPGLPWSSALSFVAAAPPLSLPVPEVDIVATEPRDGGRLLRLRLRSPRGAPTLTLMLPPDRITSVALGGFEFSRPDSRAGVSQRGYTAYAVPADGVEIAIAITGTSAIDAYVIDRSSGLPPEGEELRRARPAEATASAAGDAIVVYTKVQL